MANIRFTSTAIDAMPIPPVRTTYAPAPGTPAPKGLRLRVTPEGEKAWYWIGRVKGGEAVCCKIADYAIMTPAKAREEAARIGVGASNGINPNRAREEKREVVEAAKREAEGAATVAQLWASYEAHNLAQKKPGTVKEFTRLYTLHIAPWAVAMAKPARDITPADVEAFKMNVGKEHGIYTANRCLAIISSFYRNRGHAFGLPRNWSPTVGVDHFEETARDRVLTPGELAKVMQAIDADENATARDYFKMMIYIGMRRKSVAEMMWQDLNVPGATWKIPGVKTKNGKPLVVTLIPEALEIIQRRYKDNPPDHPFVFPSNRITAEQVAQARKLRQEGQSTRDIAKAMSIDQTSIVRMLKPEFAPAPHGHFNGAGDAWERILKRTGIKTRTTIHDLRRTFCTSLIEAGAPLPVVAAAMGHRTMETTSRHYAFASDKTVADAVRGGIGQLLANVAKSQAPAPMANPAKSA